MPEFCPQDYRPAAAQNGERLQFFSSNGRDWQQECFQGREGTAERWQQVSADIWRDRGDLPPVLAEFVTRQQQAIERADKLDPKQILNNVQAGFERKMQVDLSIASALARNESPASALKDAQNKQDWENWNNFKDYLSPAGKRASMGFALISSGIDRHIKEGEKMLVEAVRLRPELQFNGDFQKRVVQSYKDMARTRIDMGLPMYRGAPQLEPVNSGRQPILGTDPALPLLNDARKQGQERGIKNATEQYDKAIVESDNKDFSTIKGVRLATFVQRLLLDRTIIESEERGLPSGHLRNQRRMAADREAIVYDRFMSPGKIRSEAALDMIASGDPQMFERGKKLLGEALKIRPELEFSEQFNHDKQAALLQHFRNARGTEGSNVPSQPNTHQRNSDGRVYSMPFVNRPDGFRLPPLLVQPKVAERPEKQPDRIPPINTVPGANRSNENGKESDSPRVKPIVIDPSKAPKIAGADTSVRFQDLPGGNPLDKSKGYSQKDIEDLAAKGVVALLLAGGAYKLVRKGNEYFFEKQRPAYANPEKSEPREKLEPRPVTEKPAETRPNAELETERAARAEAETKVKTAGDTIAKLEAEAKTDAETRAKLEAEAKTNAETRAKLEAELKGDKAEISRLQQELDANRQGRQQESAKGAEEQRTSNETIEKLRADIAKAETDRQAEADRHAAEIERLNMARQADVQRIHAEGLAEIERLTGANKAEAERIIGEKDAEIERQKSAVERIETALADANKARDAERQAADTQRVQLETALKQSEESRTAERQTADAQRQQLEASLKESEAARTTERQNADTQRQQLEARVIESEQARTTEGEQSKAKLEQTTEQLRVAQGENAELKKLNGGLQTELETSRDKSRSETDTAKAERDRATSEQARLQQLLETSEAGKSGAEKKVTALEGELETAKAERDRVTVLAKGDRAQLEANISSLTEQLQKATEEKTALEKNTGEVSETQKRQIADLQKRLAEATGQLTEKDASLAESARKLAENDQTVAAKDQTLADKDRLLSEKDQALRENQQKLAERDQALAELRAEHERQLAEITKRAEQAEQARLAAEQGRQAAEQAKTTAEQGRLSAEKARDNADSKAADAEQARSTVTQTTEKPTAPRRRIRGGAVQLDTTVIAQNEGNGTFSREVAQGAGIDGTPESKGEKLSTDQIQLVKEEIQKLKETKIAADETKAKNLERVLSIIERTDSPRVQEAAHKYIASRILDGESKHAESTGGARATIGRGVSAGIVVSAFLSYYTMREEMLRKGEEVEAPASVGSSKK